MDNEENLIDKLSTETDKEYKNLSKWLIGLSTGAIVFSVKLITLSTPQYLSEILIWRLCFLVLCIISGVVFVRLRIDVLFYEHLNLIIQQDIKRIKGWNAEEMVDWGKKKIKANEALRIRERESERLCRKINIISNFLVVILPIQQWSFFLGIILIAIFGAHSITTR